MVVMVVLVVLVVMPRLGWGGTTLLHHSKSRHLHGRASARSRVIGLPCWRCSLRAGEMPQLFLEGGDMNMQRLAGGGVEGALGL